MKSLKPCPLCGGEVELWAAKETLSIGRVIECKKCGFRFCDPTAITDEQVIASWNKMKEQESEREV